MSVLAITPFALMSLMTIPLDLRAVKTARAYPEDALRVAPANAAVILLRSSAGVLLILGM